MPLTLEIVTAERVVYSEEVDVLVAPGVVGELGILPSHAPLLTIMQPGEIRVDKGEEQTYIAVSGGFLEVIGDKATILADTAERAEEIDEARAEEAVKRAEERITSATSALRLGARSRISKTFAGTPQGRPPAHAGPATGDACGVSILPDRDTRTRELPTLKRIPVILS